MFGNVIFSIAAFIVALGLLISIHEFGHFWVARKVGVKVLRFSIGFGKALWSKRGRVDDTEYVIAAIPLGGYVKMLDEREGDVHPAERDRAFNRKTVWQRIAVVLAGPMANILLAIVVYWIVMMMGISGVAPLIGDVTPGSSAEKAGFQFEDKIVAIEQTSTPTWNDARIALLKYALRDGDSEQTAIRFDVETVDGGSASRELVVNSKTILKGEADIVGSLGLQQWWPRVPAQIGGLQEDGAAVAAGLQIGDRVLSANGDAIDSWRDLVSVVRVSAGKTLEITVLRDASELELVLVPGVRETESNGVIGFIGAWETLSFEAAQKARVTVSYPPWQSLLKGLERTWEMSVLTLQMMKKLIVGQASLENISGPISIAQFAGQSASIGLDHYLNFIALISISLAILNLLPIPMLDGGHLLFYTYEIIFRRPPPERAQVLGQQLGILILGSLMALAFYNDIWRLVQ